MVEGTDASRLVEECAIEAKEFRKRCSRVGEVLFPRR